MEFTRSEQIKASIDEVWALVDDVPAVALCIPGVSDVVMSESNAFTCKFLQRVGSAKANFDLSSTLEVDEGTRTVLVQSDGRDRALGSSVSAKQTFALTDSDGATAVDIHADVQITGRIATFGHRIIATKAEQVTVEALRNVEQLLGSRRGASAGDL
jgi:carbon monoxide dehydrogenase subunit G